MKPLEPEVIPKRCPSCEATFAEGTFCELCGDKLVDLMPEHTGRTGPPTMPVALAPEDIPLTPSAGARPLQASRRDLSVGQALDVVRGILELACRFERDGLAWQPQPEDFFLEPSGEIVLAQARAVGRLQGQAFDVRRVLWAVRELLLPHPLVGAGADAIRFVSGRLESHSARAALVRLDEIVRRSIMLLGASPARVATACDVGLLRERNEDAVRAREGTSPAGAWVALVVCDGVSSSSHGDVASCVGADAAMASLEADAASVTRGDTRAMEGAVARAVRAAHEAILAKRIPDEGRDPSGTTIVAALVCAEKIAVSWAGDSRAYLLEGNGGRLLTRDHSWINQAEDAGVALDEETRHEPLAHALTRCIGPLEIAEGGELATPSVVITDAPAGALLVLCSDGLWSYFPTPGALRDAIGARKSAAPGVLSQMLVDQALARGGQDNVAVAVCTL